MEQCALVFDIETVADATPDNFEAIAALAAKRELSVEDYAALCPPLARVACIAWLDVAAAQLGALFDAALCAAAPPESFPLDSLAPGDGAWTCGLEACVDEADMLRRFGARIVRHLQRANACLVTFNGRGFDLPVLVHRAVKHGVAEGRDLLIKAASENRYRPLLHVDLMDVVTFGGAAPRWPMAAYAIGYGFRSPKRDLEGALVGTAVREGRLLEVVRYCAGDVLATAHIHRRWQAPAGAAPEGGRS